MKHLFLKDFTNNYAKNICTVLPLNICWAGWNVSLRAYAYPCFINAQISILNEWCWPIKN